MCMCMCDVCVAGVLFRTDRQLVGTGMLKETILLCCLPPPTLGWEGSSFTILSLCVSHCCELQVVS